MHYQYERQRLVCRNGGAACQRGSIEQKHCLYSKMPWPGTVRRGHNDCYAADNECGKPTHQSKLRREVETEEREIVMQEVASPYTEGEKDEKRNVLNTLQRCHPLPYPTQSGFHLIVERKAAQQEMQQQKHCHDTDCRDDIACGGELAEDGVETCARAEEEVAEDLHLRQQRERSDYHHQQRVYSPFRDYCAKSLCKRHPVATVENTAARKLSYPRNHQTGGVGQEYGVDACGETGPLPYRLKRLPPSDAPEQLCRNAERQGENHPCPIHIIEHHTLYPLKVKVAVHPIQYHAAQDDRQQELHRNIQYLASSHFFFL